MTTLATFLLEQLDREDAHSKDHGGDCLTSRFRADIEAKRKIIAIGYAACSSYGDRLDPNIFESGTAPHYPDDGWSWCDGCSAAEAASSRYFMVMRILAYRYRERPGFRREWLDD